MTIKEIHDLFLQSKGISKDSRQIEEGQIYLALKGESFDGNDYAFQALEKGAAYAIVNRDSEAGRSRDNRIIPVDDTLHCLWDLALFHRNTFDIPVLGLTGTNGKTTTKELIRAVLSSRYKVWATCGNLNNNIGVPLTVLGIDDSAEIAVIEMGASHPGDIRELVSIARPDFGLITNVGKAHLLGFGCFEGVKKTKGELYDFVSQEGRNMIFMNADDVNLCSMASERGIADIRKYGLKYQNAEIMATTQDNPYLGVILEGKEIRTNLVGIYNADNVLAAVAVGDYFGIGLDEAAAAISAYVPSNNRSQMQKTGRNTLIIDAYNANPTSMAASLDNFRAINASRKIVLLGDMRELGEDSVKEHEKIVTAVKEMKVAGQISEYFFVGEEFGKVTESFKDSAELRNYLEANPVNEATILIKGSRGIRMENVISAL